MPSDPLGGVTQVIETAHDTREGRRPGVIGGEADGRNAAESQNRDESEEIDRRVLNRSGTEIVPVGLHLLTWIGLKAGDRLGDRHRL